MKITIKRTALRDKYTIGKLYIDGVYFCDTLEDAVRDLNKNGVFDNGEQKVYGETAIPYGTYKVDMDTISPRLKNRSWAKPYSGKLPRIKNVNGFDGVLIHPFNDASESLGCISVGENKQVGKVLNSVTTFHKLMKILIANKNNIELTIE